MFRMEQDQALVWAEAQNLAISVDLVALTKQQLQFLAEVDRNRSLYDGPILDRAIYRYKYCWLPLLAEHTASAISEGPLVVPLDCEWIWHCHRLNPVQYEADCEELYGRILDNRNVISSITTTCRKQTEEIWDRIYPSEPYELNMSTHFSENVRNSVQTSKSTEYDLVSAVKRQSAFFYQVSRSHMNDDAFLDGALARYKGFLYLIKRNWENSERCFCVPTYDIDLIWHTHQLQSVSYCKDVMAALGKVLEHDDTDSDRTKGKKLDNGFLRTTKQWEDIFGSRYWRAGAMYRGDAPSPLGLDLSQLDNLMEEKMAPSNEDQDLFPVHRKMVMEIMIEIIGVKGLPQGHKGSLFVTISKKQPDSFLNNKRSLSILSATSEKQAIDFLCEPIGDLVFELISYKPAKTLGTTSISLKDLVSSVSLLYEDKWFDLVSNSTLADSKPISLQIALSFIPPSPAPYMVRTPPFPVIPGKFQHLKYSYVADEAGNDIIILHMREARDNYQSRKKVIGLTPCGETHVLAEPAGKGWFLNNSRWWFHLHKKLHEDGHAFGFKGNRKLIVFGGRKLGYEINSSNNQKNEEHFMTAVEFSMDHPYGKAVALMNFKSGIIEISEEESLVLPMIILAFLLSENWSNCVKSCKYEEKSAPCGECVDEKGGGEAISDRIKDFPGHEDLVKSSHSGGCGAGCGGSCGGHCAGGSCGGHCFGGDAL
ncbi:glycine-rich domain-containing protein 1-like isoform X2 [Hibiscus syriacus]|uniref:glycine-rich domain-containing protein 1-like isoform X1 n=1 Tax=Hibiscus syriacus TaxID=106335 RepID=UPI001920BA0D|nr:glycine-rich domain-containing protein 1-like isoform X1 [Hibiscus syriacus]XP_039020241.1 glycine-rich domain-containing protein 1-like isoform X2 [Hibiscus syriacus]